MSKPSLETPLDVREAAGIKRKNHSNIQIRLAAQEFKLSKKDRALPRVFSSRENVDIMEENDEHPGFKKPKLLH